MKHPDWTFSYKKRRLLLGGIGLLLSCWAIAAGASPQAHSTQVPSKTVDLTFQNAQAQELETSPEPTPTSAPTISPEPSISPTIPSESPSTSSGDDLMQTISAWLRDRRDWLLLTLQRNWKSWVIALLATVGLCVAQWILRSAFPRIDRRIQGWEGTYIRPFTIQKLEILTAQQISGFLRTVVATLKRPIDISLVVIYALVILRVFPTTQKASVVISGYVSNAVTLAWTSFINYLPNLFYIGIVLFFLKYFSQFSKFLFSNLEQDNISIPGFYREWARPTYQIIRFIALIFAIAIIFPLLPGSNSPAFQGISLVVGLLVSLGSTAAVANVVAGLALTYTRAFKVGDRVTIGDMTGDVLEKSVLVTRLRTAKKEEITIPNSTVLDSHITNYSSSAEKDGVILHLSISIGYDVPWETVHELMLSAARLTNNILSEPAPFVLQTKLDDFYVVYELNVHTKDPTSIPKTYSELYQNLQITFRDGGVDITSPHFRFVTGNEHTSE
ncbi:MAG: mechanosensitive ion channel domain-containing protein [Cyanobacteria bacterium P01_G01_bin.4]